MAIVTKSSLWYFLRQFQKLKKSTHKCPIITKNFGIWLRHDSCSGTQKSKGYRNLTVTDAVHLIKVNIRIFRLFLIILYFFDCTIFL